MSKILAMSMTRLAATVKSYENHADNFTAVVSIEVTEKFRLVQLDHGIIGALSGTSGEARNFSRSGFRRT